VVKLLKTNQTPVLMLTWSGPTSVTDTYLDNGWYYVVHMSCSVKYTMAIKMEPNLFL